MSYVHSFSGLAISSDRWLIKKRNRAVLIEGTLFVHPKVYKRLARYRGRPVPPQKLARIQVKRLPVTAPFPQKFSPPVLADQSTDALRFWWSAFAEPLQWSKCSPVMLSTKSACPLPLLPRRTAWYTDR